MTVTHGYCTLVDLKERLLATHTYTAATIALDQSTKKIIDTAKKLKRFETGMTISISGSSLCDGSYTIATGGVAGEIVVTEALALAQTTGVGDTITITDISDPVDDVSLEGAINATSREIDKYCWRRFYTTTDDETRTYTAEHCEILFPDDILTVTSLKTDDDVDGTYEDTWTVGRDYVLMPENASLDGLPYTRIELGYNPQYIFPTGHRKGVQIVGTFGYSVTTPDIIHEACLIQAARLFKRKDAPFGIVGAPEFGTMRLEKLDPDIQRMLGEMRRLI